MNDDKLINVISESISKEILRSPQFARKILELLIIDENLLAKIIDKVDSDALANAIAARLFWLADTGRSSSALGNRATLLKLATEKASTIMAERIANEVQTV